MSYFSRLTDIVTCNLSEILANESDPNAAIQKIIHEMEEGLAGATRSVQTATTAEERLKSELVEQKSQIDYWTDQAKEHLQNENEDQARLALVRKHEVEDVIAGLEQQLKAALATREHLTTTKRALEARLAEARRKLQLLESGAVSETLDDTPTSSTLREAASASGDSRNAEIDAELAALKKQLGD